tara:strand:+ start:83 stop:625 length:543 start_codon:yes stop_codon:yes gene_type:complete
MNLFNLFSKQDKLKANKNLYSHYEKVSEDIKKGKKDEGVWTKAFANSDGDLQKTKANYITLMVEKIILEKEAKNEQRRNLEIERLEKIKAKIKQEKENEWQKLKAEIDASFPDWTGGEYLAVVIMYIAIFLLEMEGVTKLITPWFPIFFPENMYVSALIMSVFIIFISFMIVGAIRIFRK